MNLDQALQAALRHHQAGQLAQAEDIYRQMLAQDPNQPDALCLLGVVAEQTCRRELALELLNKAITSRSGFADAYYHLGNILQRTGRSEEAAAAFRDAANARAGFAEAWYALGNAQANVEKFDEAIASYRQAIACRPNLLEAHNNLAAALKDRGLLDEALAACNAALALMPTYPEAQMNLAQILLVRGDFIRGWKALEWRWRSRGFAALRRDFVQPLWDGSDLRGRTILLHEEQGFGDTIQFIRYVPLVAARGGKVLFGCPPVLRRLLRHTPGVLHWLEQGEPITRFDCHCPLMSLAGAFGTQLHSIPCSVPYIQADAADVERWQKRLAGDTHFKVGLAWAGNPAHQKDKSRSISLTLLAPLAKVAGISFYSLQKGDASAAVKNPPPGFNLIDYTAELNDFADTAALIANLDLVIAVDTAVTHLAGAMGKPVWTLLPFSPDWRWLLNRADSPWYPTMRLFRQPAIGDWASVVRNVAEALSAHGCGTQSRATGLGKSQ